MRRLVPLSALMVAVALQGCDSGPKGPGPLSAVVQTRGAEVGALVVRVTGPGVTGFQEVGSTRLFSRAVSTEEHRVVLVGTGQEDIRFNVLVAAREDPVPSIFVVEAVDVANQTITPSGITVSVGR